MTSRRFVFAMVCALSASACHKPLDDGYAVDITVKAIDALPPATLAAVQSLDFAVRGAERVNMSFPVTRAFATQRRETVIYRPLVPSGELSFVVRARDASGAVVGYAVGKSSLVAKQTVSLTLALSDELPPALLDADAQRDFGTVLVGQPSGPQVLTVSNLGGMPSGPLTVTLGGDDADAFSIATDLCSGNALDAGQSCTITLAAAPTHAGSLAAVVTATATPGGDVAIALSATSQEPGALKADPSSHDFGAVVVGQTSDPSVFTVTNSGAVALGPLTPSVTGSAAQAFAIGTETCTGATLPPGATCTVSVSFKPTSDGVVSASLQVGDGTSTPAVANVQGTGLSPSRLQLTPLMPDFGSIVVGSTIDLTVTVKNVGGAATGALASMLGGSDAAQFSLLTDGCAGQPLAAGGSCAIAVRFQPTSAGGKSATLTVTATPGGSAMSTLNGTALQPGALSIAPGKGDFGTLLVSTKSPVQTFTVTNTGGAPTGSLSVALSGSDTTQFKITGDNCSGNTLGGGGTCQVNLQFAPDSAGNKSASLVVGANPGGNASSVLVGVSQRPAVLQASPGTSASLGTTTVGVAGSMAIFTIINGGDQPTTALGTTTGGSIGDFVLTDGCAGQTLSGGGSCTVKAQLQPTSYGQKSASVTLSASTGGSVQLNLSGVGQDTVTLTLTTPGSGGGTLSATGQTACTTGPCTWTFTRGATVPSVTLNEAPDATSDFSGWGGDCSGTATSCTLSMSANRSASATFTRRKVTLTVHEPAVDGATGTVTSSVGGLSCGATCSVSIDAGTTVTLTAAPASGAVFQGWFGDCSGDQTTCTVKMDAARTVGASFLHQKYNFVFTTSQTWDGALGGLAGADGKCQAAATAAGLHGTYKAYLAAAAGPTTTVSRLGSARGWVRRDGRPFADQSTDLVSAGHFKTYYPPRLDEYGHDAPYGSYVFTGSDGSGNPAYNMGTPYTCADWTSNASTAQQYNGHSSGMGGAWSSGYIGYCSTPAALLCFGVDVTATLGFTKASGRTAFVSQAAFDPSTGIAGADKLCKDEATTVGLAGSYLALIGTSTMPAASRFSSALAPWVNVNGVAVSERAVDLFTPGTPLLAGIYLTGNGSLAGNVAANGSNDPNKAGTNTCKDWTSKASTDSADVGVPSESSAAEVFGGLTWDCSTIATFGHVYCLQQ